VSTGNKRREKGKEKPSHPQDREANIAKNLINAQEKPVRLLFQRQRRRFFFRSQPSVAFETGKVLPNPERHQTAANEHPAGDRFGMMFANLPGPAQHFGSDLNIGNMAVRLALGKDMPKDDQKTTGNCDDRFSRDEAHRIPPFRGIAETGDLGMELGNLRFEVIGDFK
jgi:hypothetical protein